MAEENASTPAPTPPPPPAPKPQAPRIEPKRKGFDPLRPLRYAKGFVFGTLGHGLDGMASMGRMGFFAGIAGGLLMCISGPFSFGLILMGAVAGLAAGAAVGGAIGVATGGFKGLGREQRKEQYADELAQRKDARTTRPARGPAPNYRAGLQRNEQVSNFNFERTQQQNREYDRDHTFNGEPARSTTHWQDYVGSRDANMERGGR